MIKFNETDHAISLTRGDTAKFTVLIDDERTESPYYLEENDELTLTVKKRLTDQTIVMQKVNEGTDQFHIEPSDTSDLSYGRYFYDIQLTKASGDVYTIIGPAIFEILPEVTW